MGRTVPFARRPRSARDPLQQPDVFKQLTGLLMDLRHQLAEPCKTCHDAELASAARRLAAIIERIQTEGRR
jgi:hypothetical protein